MQVNDRHVPCLRRFVFPGQYRHGRKNGGAPDVRHLPVIAGATLLDVYCGVGLFSAFFAPRVGRLIGIESSPSACADFEHQPGRVRQRRAIRSSCRRCAACVGCQTRRCRSWTHPAPAWRNAPSMPSWRLAPGGSRTCRATPPPWRVMLPASSPGAYRLVQVTPFDLFPQTYHIESISIFEKV